MHLHERDDANLLLHPRVCLCVYAHAHVRWRVHPRVLMRVSVCVRVRALAHGCSKIFHSIGKIHQLVQRNQQPITKLVRDLIAIKVVQLFMKMAATMN